MYLSEAIRLGAMMKPQGFDGTGERGLPQTCAFGAALDATGQDNVEEVWPWLESMRCRCPINGCSIESYYRDANGQWSRALIPHLNNCHQWTRERIADWVEEQEYRLGIRAKEEMVEVEVREALTLACS